MKDADPKKCSMSNTLNVNRNSFCHLQTMLAYMVSVNIKNHCNKTSVIPNLAECPQGCQCAKGLKPVTANRSHALRRRCRSQLFCSLVKAHAKTAFQLDRWRVWELNLTFDTLSVWNVYHGNYLMLSDALSEFMLRQVFYSYVRHQKDVKWHKS